VHHPPRIRRMSSIFDVVEHASGARKNRIMSSAPSRTVFPGAYTGQTFPTPAQHLEAHTAANPGATFDRDVDRRAVYQLQHSRHETMYPMPPDSFASKPYGHTHEATMPYPPRAHAYPHESAQTQQTSSSNSREQCKHVIRPARYPRQANTVEMDTNTLPLSENTIHAGNISTTDKYKQQTNTAIIVWLVCVISTLLPVMVAVVNVIRAPGFSEDMLRVPYQCNIFHFGLFIGLPGISVHTFILSLRFHKTCRHGVFLSIAAIVLLVISVEHACSHTVSISVDQTFFLLTISIYFGLISQHLFISILCKHDYSRHAVRATIGLAYVLALFSVLSIFVSVLNSEVPHTKATVLIRIVPLSCALTIYVLSTYFTILRVTISCNNFLGPGPLWGVSGTMDLREAMKVGLGDGHDAPHGVSTAYS